MGDAQRGIDVGKRVHSSWGGTIVVCGLALVPILFHRTLAPIAQPLLTKIPQRFRGLTMVGVPAALIYVTRWRGTQTQGDAIVTVGLPLALGFVLIAARPLIDERLGSFYERRNRVLPRGARFAL